jgi:hypothetical protein
MEHSKATIIARHTRNIRSTVIFLSLYVTRSQMNAYQQIPKSAPLLI